MSTETDFRLGQVVDRRTSMREDVPPPARRVPYVMARPSDSSACGFYRTIQPLRRLEKQGRITLTIAQDADGYFGLPGGVKFDVLVLQKLGGGIAPGDRDDEDLIEDVRRCASRVVYEIDDDLENVTKENPVKNPREFPGYIERTRNLQRACRLMTTTTDYLAKRLRRINPDVRVVPNGIDLELWKSAPEPEGLSRADQVRIVWACSPMHVEDARLLIGPFRHIARKYGERVKLVLAGGNFPELRKAVPEIEYAGCVYDMAKWPAFARSLRPDIWVAPLVDSVFARSKSNLKFLEGAALGCAVVASDVEPYRIAHDGSAWVVPPMGLVRSSREWIVTLENLIEHESLRREIAFRGVQVVSEYYTAQHTADAWMRVIEEVAG